ncbi:hypothetical protein [Sphaerisporangium aureirubrum]|uniref:Vegetative cell wall protein gp1 n=1 Tax=Sphaerisporangium aureirubrum TaxID=1544736 RepID=A0ABW1NE30_9ACTN
MEALLGELGRRIADRWLVQLVLPGLLWLAAAATALTLGHARALDFDRLVRHADLAARAVPARPAPITLTIAAALALAALAGLAAQLIARALQAVWAGQWKPPAGSLAGRLTSRRTKKARDRGPVPDRYLPARPTWIGDRLRLAGERVNAQYGLHLPIIWTALWQLLDDPARTPVQDARDRFDQSLRLAAWGVLHIALAVLWWPALLIGAVTLTTAWRRGRATAATLADVVEATVDTHHRALADSLGIQLPHGRLTAAESALINDQLYKGHSRP